MKLTYYVTSPLLLKSSRLMDLRYFKKDTTDCIRTDMQENLNKQK
jgi:hypothetical protein